MNNTLMTQRRIKIILHNIIDASLLEARDKMLRVRSKMHPHQVACVWKLIGSQGCYPQQEIHAVMSAITECGSRSLGWLEVVTGASPARI